MNAILFYLFKFGVSIGALIINSSKGVACAVKFAIFFSKKMVE